MRLRADPAHPAYPARLLARTVQLSRPEERMKLIGIALIVVGVLALALGGIRYTTREKVLDLGPIEATTEKHKIDSACRPLLASRRSSAVSPFLRSGRGRARRKAGLSRPLRFRPEDVVHARHLDGARDSARGRRARSSSDRRRRRPRSCPGCDVLLGDALDVGRGDRLNVLDVLREVVVGQVKDERVLEPPRDVAGGFEAARDTGARRSSSRARVRPPAPAAGCRSAR